MTFRNGFGSEEVLMCHNRLLQKNSGDHVAVKPVEPATL
ncbi:hypothetical protein CFter6_4917 [Collimonas fungivorans]|uniref:Uncharacterized protein n=1 Tax=Collimonas fungivorans TaxID=158899 RepID=A0A127PJ86_9BURK|nr:hypothetical protein CFter6_4917 [Collimonas fungivorans]